ncbi:MAG: hypothetical protein J5950_02395, partial [Clostridia bacterium]|nr:hypothetical protein [Clostridia bacterium]
MDAQSPEKRGRGRPRKNPPPTIVAKSTIIRRTVPTDNDGIGTEVLHSSIDFVGDNVVPIVRSALTTDASGTPGAGSASAAAPSAQSAVLAPAGAGAGAAAAA